MPEIAHRVHRVVQLRAAEVLPGLRQRRHEMGVLRAGQRYHGEPVRKRGQVLLQLVRRAACRDEVHLVEIEAPVRGSRHHQMACMNGVKGAAKKSDAPWVMFCRCAVRLRRRQTVPSAVPTPTPVHWETTSRAMLRTELSGVPESHDSLT